MTNARKILVVDDEAGMRDFLAYELSERGYEVTACSGGLEALEKARGGKFDLAISDVMMPGMSGLEFLEAIKKIMPAVEVIVATGNANVQIAVSAMKKGAYDFVQKPYDLDLLTALVEKALEKSEMRSHIGRVEDQVTELREAYRQLETLQSQLVHSEKMAAVGQLAGGVAHDFNNVLTVILGMSEMAIDALDAEHPVRRDLEEIKTAGERAAVLTRQLLAFSRKQVLQPKRTDLNTVIEGMWKMLQRLIPENIALSTALDPTLGAVKVDPGQFEQVLMNLVVNARDAMPAGGKLVITTKNVERADEDRLSIEHIPAGSCVSVSVADTGCGMSGETISRIFEPFFTTKMKGVGTGLGLATVYGIVKQSGGHVAVRSEVGKGSTFQVYLPTTSEAHEAEERRPAFVPARGSETVLLVEDEDAVRRLARRVLTANGYAVLEAHHGLEAISVSEGHAGPIHLLVTDVIMPHMGGGDLADALRLARPEMRVLFISGYTENSLNSECLGGGAFFLPKPLTPDALLHQARELLNAPLA